MKMIFVNKIVQFFKESKQELSKVVWPKRENVLKSTIFIIITIIISALVLAGFDLLLIKIVQFFVVK